MTRRRDPFAERGARAVRREAAFSVSPVEVPKGCVVAMLAGPAAAQRAVARAARQLAGDGPVLGLTDRTPEDSGAFGADMVADVAPEALPALWPALEPRALVLPEDGGLLSDLGRRMATGLGLSVAVRVVALADGQARSATNLDGQEWSVPLPQVLLVDRRFTAPEPPAKSACRAILPAIAPSAVPVPSAILDPDPQEVPLSEAVFVVSAGAGVRDLALFHRFARALGATPGASRVLVDAGLMPRDRQVGASGERTAADLYVALGISGAVQHLEGISECRQVIAVNLDRTCPITSRANLTLVGDAEAFMRAVLDRLEAGR